MAFPQQPNYTTGPAQPHFSSRISSSTITERKTSLPANSSSIAGAHTDWHDISMDSKSVDDNVNDLAIPHENAINPTHFKNERGWSPNERASAFNHAEDFDPMVSDYSVHGGATQLSVPFDTQPQNAQADPTTANANTMTSMPALGQFPMSPQQQTWMPTQVSESFEFSPLAPQGTRHTPVFATSTSILRRDGIRKKNARFEIPAERNLRTIDQLIAQTTDETEIKELKQQKRLLRNRQAALDSRQRKKQHTERLEEEKKQYTNLLTEMDEELASMRLREAEWMRQRDELLQTNARLHQWCQQVQSEKEESIRSHTVETGQLRKENSMLLEQLQRIDASHLSAPASAGLTTDFSEFEQLTIQSNSWENFPIHGEFNVEPGSSNDGALGTISKTMSSGNNKDEKTPATGLLLVLLLCGAWIISKAPATGSDLIPTVSEELRVASTTVIEGLYKDSGVTFPDTGVANNSEVLLDPEISDLRREHCSDPIEDSSMQGFDTDKTSHQMSELRMRQDALDSNDRQVLCPPMENSDSSQMAKILRDALNSAHAANNARASNPEMFAKSLLMDKVPTQVLKDFSQMVARGRASKQDAILLNHSLHNYD